MESCAEVSDRYSGIQAYQGRTALENVPYGNAFLNIPNRQMVNSAKEALTKVGLGHKAW